MIRQMLYALHYIIDLFHICKIQWNIIKDEDEDECSGGITAHPAPTQKIPSAKIRWKSSRLDFLGSRRHLPRRLSSKGPNYQRGVLLISAGAVEGHF